jgi:hypothetical protein
VRQYLFILHVDGEDATCTEIECVDDAEALMTAAHLTQICDVDVWAQERIVGSVRRRDYLAKAS